MNFAEKIISIAKERDIPLSKICKDTGIATTSFQNWKNGSQPTIDKAIKIIKYLELSADELFDIKPIRNPIIINNENCLTEANLKILKKRIPVYEEMINNADSTEDKEVYIKGVLKIINDIIK